MNYELVYLEKKIVAGLRIRTSNSSPTMTKNIGELWQGFYATGIYKSISGKLSDKSIGLYTNYECDMKGEYDVMVCCEIQNISNLPAMVQVETIPTGKYAKFVVHGDMQKAVAEFWMKLWSMNLDRKYSCDFEEYQSGCDMTNEEIHIYISLN